MAKRRLHLWVGVAGAICALWVVERGSPVSAPPPAPSPPLASGIAPAPTAVLVAAPAPVSAAPSRIPATAATSSADGEEEREARRIDALVALDHIGEAHSAAMAFIQRHPSGPFSAHVMNLMGVHPRPPGALPRELEESR